MKKAFITFFLIFFQLILVGCKIKKEDYLTYSKIDYEYSGSGTIKIVMDTYSENIKANFRTDYIYDENDNEIFKYEYQYNGKEWVLIFETDKKYNENNKLEECVKINVASSSSTTTYYSYNDKGLLAMEVENENWYKSYTTYSYDENDNLVLEYTDSSIPSRIGEHKCEYEYDLNNNLILETYGSKYDGDSESDDWMFRTRYVYNYDENNRLLEKVFYYEPYESNKWEKERLDKYSYDADGNIKEDLEFEVDRTNDSWVESKKTTYEYDLNNNMTKKTYLVPGKKDWERQVAIEYKYDSNNRLIETSRYQNDKLIKKTEEYYFIYEK
ncbi:MAG: hypothetical protein K6E87_06035 [bacterium]|nr:hypothetical protein [bacterium]